MAPCSSRARVAHSGWWLASASASCRGQSSIEQPAAGPGWHDLYTGHAAAPLGGYMSAAVM